MSCFTAARDADGQRRYTARAFKPLEHGSRRSGPGRGTFSSLGIGKPIDLDPLGADAPLVRKDDSGKQVQQRRLAAAAGSDEGRLGPLLQQEIGDSKLEIAATVAKFEFFNRDHNDLLPPIEAGNRCDRS